LPAERTAAVLVLPATAAGTGLVASYCHSIRAGSALAPRGLRPANTTLRSISSMALIRPTAK
jgi:hypothetical protein